MRIAVLPFNAAEGTKPALGRQFAAFAAEQLRAHAEADINVVSFLTQIDDESGEQRMAFVNISDALLPYEQLKDLFEQADVALVQDGMLEQDGDAFDLTLRFHGKESEEPIRQDEIRFDKIDLFKTLHGLIKTLAEVAAIPLPEELSGETMEFGTDDADVFLDFLEGYDALTYVNQANGLVAREFSPQGAFDSLVRATEKDPDFEGPYQVGVQLARQCGAHRIGTLEMIEAALKRLTELASDDFAAYFALGELYGSVNDFNRAADLFEKALQKNPDDPALLARLGIAQMQGGMPVNAERNFRKAMELEGDGQAQRGPARPGLEQHQPGARGAAALALDPREANPPERRGPCEVRSRRLMQAGNEDQAVKAFENGLEVLEDNTVVKRFYAPLLVTEGGLRPGDGLLRGRDRGRAEGGSGAHRVRPDAGGRRPAARGAGRAEAGPRQPSRIPTRARRSSRGWSRSSSRSGWRTSRRRGRRWRRATSRARCASCRPLKNWLADYWKLWFFLAAANNQVEQYDEAAEAAQRALEIFPGCEPAFGEFATALTGQGKHEEAYNLMRFAAANNPGSLPIHLNLGLAAKRAGHADEARATWPGRSARPWRTTRTATQIEPILDEMEA